MGDVIKLPRAKTVSEILTDAHEENLSNVIVIGETQDGSTHISTSIVDIPLAIFLLVVAKKAVLDSSMPEFEE